MVILAINLGYRPSPTFSEMMNDHGTIEKINMEVFEQIGYVKSFAVLTTMYETPKNEIRRDCNEWAAKATEIQPSSSPDIHISNLFSTTKC